MTDLVEKVAREICLAEGLGPDTGVYDGRDNYLGKAWERRIPQAHAAIRIALEEAAKVVEAHLCVPWFIDENGEGRRDDASAKAGNENIARISAAILSLLSEEPTR
jgi:hypothetical protein